jgi:16S rRNA processing protein RimM
VATRITPTPGVSADGWVSLGVVARAHGIKGGLKLHLWNENTAVLRGGLEVKVGGKLCRVNAYAAGLLHLAGVDDRNAAEALQGQEISARRADFPEDDTSTYLVDIVGARVEDTQGRVLGVVTSFGDNGAQALLAVTTPGPGGKSSEVLVPYVPPIVQHVERGRVVLQPPPGMFDDDAIVDETGADLEDPTIDTSTAPKK